MKKTFRRDVAHWVCITQFWGLLAPLAYSNRAQAKAGDGRSPAIDPDSSTIVKPQPEGAAHPINPVAPPPSVAATGPLSQGVAAMSPAIATRQPSSAEEAPTSLPVFTQLSDKELEDGRYVLSPEVQESGGYVDYGHFGIPQGAPDSGNLEDNDDGIDSVTGSEPLEVQAAVKQHEIENLVPPHVKQAIQSFKSTLYGDAKKDDTPGKLSGYMKDLADRIMESERQEDPLIRPKVKHSEKDSGENTLFNLQKRAREIKSLVENDLFSKNLTTKQKIAVLQAYIRDVLMPMRDLISLVWTAQDYKRDGNNPIREFFPNFPREIAPKKSETEKSAAEKAISDGEDSKNPLGLLLKDLPDSGNACLKRTARVEFDFNPLNALRHDVKSLANAVTAQQYARGLKTLTMQMILDQISAFNTYLGDEAPVIIPQGCRQGIGYEFPAQVKLPIPTPEVRAAALDSLLAKTGIVAGTADYKEYFLDYVKADPRDSGFTGYLPYERVLAAQRGLDPKTPYALEPAIDDVKDFDVVLGIVAPKALGAIPPRHAQYASIAKEIMSVSHEDLILLDKGKEITAKTKGFSNYLVEQMRSKQATDARKVICPAAKKQLESTLTRLPLPKIDGPDAARRWGLSELSKFASDSLLLINQDTRSLSRAESAKLDAIRETLKMNCPAKYCGGRKPTGIRGWLSHMSETLAPFDDPYEYVPKQAFEEKSLRDEYPLFSNLWNDLRDRNLMPTAVVSEMDSIFARIHDTPWASMRLAYVVAQKCSDAAPARGGVNPYDFFGRPLGLWKPFLPDVGNRILSQDEKRKVWTKIIEDTNRDSGFLLGTEIPKAPPGLSEQVDHAIEHFWELGVEKIPKGPSAFDRIEELHRRPPLLTPEDARKAAESSAPRGSGKSIALAQEAVWKDPQSKLAAGLFDLYKARGDNDAQQKIFDSLSKDYGPTLDALVTSEWQKEVDLAKKTGKEPPRKRTVGDGVKAKIAFLDLDTKLKRPVYHAIFREASLKRKSELINTLRDLCASDPSNNKEFKQIVYKTVSAQDELNQIMGLPELPASVKERMGKWASTDRANMALSLTQMAFFVGASVAAGSCVMTTGGICAPMAAALMSAAATGTQVWIAKNSINAASDAAEHARTVQAYADLGLTTQASVGESKEGHGYLAATFDVAFTAPLLGPTADAVWTGSRSFAGGFKAALNGNSPFDRTILRSAAQSHQYLKSLYTLGALKIPRLFSNPSTDSTLVKDLLETASVSAHSMTEAKAKLLLAQKVSGEFGGDMAKFRSFLESYTGSRLDKYERLLDSWEGKYTQSEELNLLRRVIEKTGLPQWRAESLAAHVVNGKRIKLVVDELKELEQLRGESLEAYIEKNYERLQELLTELPVRRREYPYFALQGVPGGVLGPLEKSLNVKRAFAAADSVLTEVYRAEALKRLGMHNVVEAHTTYELVKTFTDRVALQAAEAASSGGNPRVAEKVHGQLSSFKDQVVERILAWQKKNGSVDALPDRAQLKAMLFGGPDRVGSIGGKMLWNQTPPEVLFDIPALQGSADIVAKKLSNYKDADEFENYLTALKILSLTKKPAPIPN